MLKGQCCFNSLLGISKEFAGELSQKSLEKWKLLQNKYSLEDEQTEPMVSIIANDNRVEYNLRYIVNYKKGRVTKTELFSRIRKKVEATDCQNKFASATFQLVEVPDFKVKIAGNTNGKGN